MKLVCCVWEDASVVDSDTWVAREGMKDAEPVIFHQVGYVVSLTPTELVLTACVSKDSIAARDRIPAGMIRSLVELDPVGRPLAIPKRKRKAA